MKVRACNFFFFAFVAPLFLPLNLVSRSRFADRDRRVQPRRAGHDVRPREAHRANAEHQGTHLFRMHARCEHRLLLHFPSYAPLLTPARSHARADRLAAVLRGLPVGAQRSRPRVHGVPDQGRAFYSCCWVAFLLFRPEPGSRSTFTIPSRSLRTLTLCPWLAFPVPFTVSSDEHVLQVLFGGESRTRSHGMECDTVHSAAVGYLLLLEIRRSLHRCSLNDYLSPLSRSPNRALHFPLQLFVHGNHEASNFLLETFHGGWMAPNIYYMGFANVVRRRVNAACMRA